MTRVRIATVYTELGIGGDENRLLTFARHLDRSRFEHLVVTLNESNETRLGPMATAYREAGVRVICLGERRRREMRRLPRPVSAARDGARTLRIVARLARLFRRERIDVVDGRGIYNMVIGLLGARAARVRAAIATEYYGAFWSRAPWRWIGPSIFDGYDAVISDSRYTIDRYRADLGRPLAHAVVVPNGVPAPAATLDRRSVRGALDLPPGATVVGQVARLVEYKGARQLLRAAALVRRRRPDVWFLLCGYDGDDDAYVRSLRDEAAALGVADRVRIAPWPGPIGDVWAAIDLHAHPSLLDSSPIAIHESMAVGLPLVATTTGGIPELVEDGRTGLLVPPGDPDAVAAALLRLLGEPATAARLGAAARRRWEERHQPEQMTRALEGVIDDVLARRRR